MSPREQVLREGVAAYRDSLLYEVGRAVFLHAMGVMPLSDVGGILYELNKLDAIDLPALAALLDEAKP